MSPYQRYRSANGRAAILISVAKVQGSAPREAGAQLLVTQDACHGSIGGGNLEWRAIRIARERLSEMRHTPSAGFAPYSERFTLGASLAQCCGGAVELVFEALSANDDALWRQIDERLQQGQNSCRAVALDSVSGSAESASHSALFDGDGKPLPPPLSGLAAIPPALLNTSERLYTAPDGRRYLLDVYRGAYPQLYLFGAGHVGSAIVRTLAELPCRITLIDQRAEYITQKLTPQANLHTLHDDENGDLGTDLIANAAPGGYYLITTHSHALDQRLVETVLQHNKFAWLGLIGSSTKRKLFEQRLHARGLDPSKLCCPIGLPGIHGKQPQIIAISVAAQLLQLWQHKTATSEPQP